MTPLGLQQYYLFLSVHLEEGWRRTASAWRARCIVLHAVRDAWQGYEAQGTDRKPGNGGNWKMSRATLITAVEIQIDRNFSVV